MGKIFKFLILVLIVVGGLSFKEEIMAVTKVTPTVTPTLIPTPTEVKLAGNLTETTDGEARYRLESVLEKRPVGRWNGINSFRKMTEIAIGRGVAANTIVLLLLLPVVATLVGVVHYVVGLSGYGIFMPTMMAVTFLVTGMLGGLSLFVLILMVSLVSNWILRRYKLHFWPARSINVMLISVVTFGMMTMSTSFSIIDLSKLSIFPVMFMILLVEEFVRTQLIKSKKEAVNLTIGTMALAMIGAMIMRQREVQEWVLLNPEITLVIVLVINVLVGSYSGIRWSEISRFRKAIRKK